MWPWKRKAAEPRRLDLDERLELLERDMKNMRLEWEDTYEKYLHLMRRLNKRDARAAEEPAPVRAEPEPGNGVDVATTSRATWSAQQKAIQAQIDARRARGLGTFTDVPPR